MSNSGPGFQQDLVAAEISPAGAITNGFGLAGVAVPTPLQVYDLTLDPDIGAADALDGIQWQVEVPSEPGANARIAVYADNGTATGILRVSIIDPATGLAANLLTSIRVTAKRFGAPS